MKTVIKAEIVAHSINEQGDELISVLATFPRIILAEVNTHRMLSKNTSSSRAIPFNKMVETIKEDPFIPIAWQKEHKGMQGSEYFTSESDIELLRQNWLKGRDYAVITAKAGTLLGSTKQLNNRLLEPFMWTTMLITGPRSGWENFFHLRCPAYEIETREGNFYYKSKKDYQQMLIDNGFSYQIPEENWKILNKGQAEIHMMALAECIWDAYNESTPKQLSPNEWHIPFKDEIDLQDWYNNIKRPTAAFWNELEGYEQDKYIVKVSTAMAARTSYTVVGEEKGLDYKAMIGLHDRLIAQDPPHSSPLEHCARAMSDEEHGSYIKGKIDLIDIDEPEYNGGIYEPKFSEKGWCNNFKGFIPYRYLVDNKVSV